MKTKLKLKKDVILSLSNIQKTRGGGTILDKDETWKPDCPGTVSTFFSNCNCATVANCETQMGPCPSNPATGDCVETDHCSYPCATEGYTNCDQCDIIVGPPGEGPITEATV